MVNTSNSDSDQIDGLLFFATICEKNTGGDGSMESILRSFWDLVDALELREEIARKMGVEARKKLSQKTPSFLEFLAENNHIM